MPLSLSPRPLFNGARLAGALAISIVVAGCVTAGRRGGRRGHPVGSGRLALAVHARPASPQPSGSFSASGFYLRAWQTQALAPQYTFTWLPQATISDGQYIDGIVAVPAIYPGPLWVGPSVQSISAKGIDAIVAEARKQGLLGSTSDFTGAPMAGAVTGHIQLIVDGTTYDLTGSPDAVAAAGATPAPGTAAAFAAFWQNSPVSACGSPTSSASPPPTSPRAWPSWRSRRRATPAASSRT